MLEVLNNPSIQAVKEASGDIGYYSKIVMNTSTPILSGDDFTYLASLAIGGKGVISVITNIFPKAFVEMTKAHYEGNHERAVKIHNALYPITETLFKEPNPAPAKAVLSMMGICKNTLRLPLTPVMQSTYDELKQRLSDTQKALNEIL